MSVRLRVVTNSEMSVRRRCPREHHIAYELGYRPIEDAEALRFGTLIHLGLESWWRGRGVDAAIETVTLRASDPYEAAKVRVLLRGYDARWGGETHDVVSVEQEFRAPLINPESGAASRTFELGGKIDVLLRRAFVEHKCLAGSSRIFDHATGRHWTLTELCMHGHAPRVTALAENGKLITANAKVPIAQPARTTIRVGTREGRLLVASSNHPFFTPRGWVRAGDLTTEDWVATPRHQASGNLGMDLPDEAFRLAGYMIGDGCLSNMTFCKGDERVLADVVACGRVLGEEAGRHDSAERKPTLRFSHVGPVAAILAQLGVSGGAAHKRATQASMSTRQVGQFIAGLWSTDGCIDAFGGRKPRIIYTSVSERLCRDVQELLQRLGMASSFNETTVPYRGERRAVFTTKVVSRASKRRFVELVHDGVIPLSRSAIPLDEFLAAIPTSSQKSDESLQPRFDEDVWWDRVASIEAGAKEILFDLEVPGPHTFVSEGIITHNTTSEEIGLGSTYWRRLTLDPQVSTYYAGAKSLGHEVDHCVYDVIRKPAQRPSQVPLKDEDGLKIVLDLNSNRVRTKDGKKWRQTGDNELGYVLQTRPETPEEYEARLTEEIAEQPDRYYQRGEVVRLESEEREAKLDAWQITRAIREAELSGAHPRNPDACLRYGRTCGFFDVCCGTASLDDETRFMRVDNVHPELSAEAAE